MAVSKGKLLPIRVKAAATRPGYRTSLSGGAAAIYELPSPKPPLRTVMVRADASMVVGLRFSTTFREPIRVNRVLDRTFEIRTVVYRLVRKECDMAIRASGDIGNRLDAAIRVTRPAQSRGDTRQTIGSPVGAAADLILTIYSVLIDESHVIAT